MLTLRALLDRMRQMLDAIPASPHQAEVNPETGQSLLEYALILILVSIAVLVVLVLLGPQVTNMFENILEGVQKASSNI